MDTKIAAPKSAAKNASAQTQSPAMVASAPKRSFFNRAKTTQQVQNQPQKTQQQVRQTTFSQVAVRTSAMQTNQHRANLQSETNNNSSTSKTSGGIAGAHSFLRTSNQRQAIAPFAKAKSSLREPASQQSAHNTYISTGSNKNLKVIFLGGVGEIGKNMTLLECGEDIIIIDSGLAFPDEYMPGIDLVIPDFTYLKQNAKRVKGIIITHGHEDHIGSVPYLLREVNAPVYASRLTLALLENKLQEHDKVKMNGVAVRPRVSARIGCFNVEFLKVNHSIAGSLALAISSPAGNVVHTGDFKIDYTPIENETTDLMRLADYGNRGVTLLLCESTNVCREGFTMSERTVGEALGEIFAQHKEKRIFVATFATNTYRLQQVFDLCEKFKRKIAFTGRSMINVCDTAIKIGELKMNKENIIDIEKIANYKDSEVLILTTGSQGEPMSALTRMAADDFNKIKLGGNDCVIFSSSPIPGNEKMVNRVVNALYKKGVTVINDELADTHVSGHACREELKIIHKLVKPKFFIPIHGEYKHLKVHEQLALSMGMEQRNIFIPDLGFVVEVNREMLKFAGVVPSGISLVDGLGVGDAGSVVLRDRLQLAEDGLCVAIIGLNSASGDITSGPDLISRGLVYAQEIPDIISEAKEVVANTIKGINFKNNDMNEVKNIVRRSLQGYFFKKTHRRPMILTIIIEN